MEFGFLEILNIFGALGFFIYGMKVMSDGIQKAAGDRFRGILRAMTTNRITGMITGFLTTSVIQSSSATTVMIVSFVNAKLLTLRQAIGVIMGANIGTTMTAWMILFVSFSFKVSTIALPVLAVGVPLLFFRSEKNKYLGEFLVGFGLLFLGLNELRETVAGLHLGNNATFISFISGLGSEPTLMITLLFVLIGTLLTIIVQSSSAAMALTLAFIEAGLPFHLAAAIVLGENIGTTVTANLAAIIGNISAKRAAFAHFIFNLFGVIWMVILFTPFVGWITNLFDVLFEKIGAKSDLITEKDRYSLALFHTVFNVINTILLISFVPQIEKVTTYIFPGKSNKHNFSGEIMGKDIISTSEGVILEAKAEIGKYTQLIREMGRKFKMLVNETEMKDFSNLIDELSKLEEETDRMEEQIGLFLLNVSHGINSQTGANRIKALQTIIGDLERMGDYYYKLTFEMKAKKENKQWFTQGQRNNLNKMILKVDEALLIFSENLNKSPAEMDLKRAHDKEEEMNLLRDSILDTHMRAVERGEYKELAAEHYKNLFSGLERLGDYAYNLSVALKSEA